MSEERHTAEFARVLTDELVPLHSGRVSRDSIATDGANPKQV